MGKKEIPQASTPDHVQGFHLARSGIRGRIVRLGDGLDAIIKRHKYPPVVAALLAETMALTVGLAYALKHEGTFTLQTKGDGPVGMLVVDITKGGAMRGYAQYDEERLRHAGVGSALLLGKGHLAFTIDQGDHTDRYQGIVDLIGRDMASIVQNYFRQSEQLETAFKVFAAESKGGAWQAGAIMVQRIPEGGGYAANNNSPGGAPSIEEREEDWRRTTTLMNTITEGEMLDGALSSQQLLHQLFHEEELTTDDVLPLQDECRCSRQRVAMVLSTIPDTEINDLMVEGKVQVKCEFCSATYDFDEEQLKQVQAGPGVRS
jgi:molecular chaperone Hsp33